MGEPGGDRRGGETLPLAAALYEACDLAEPCECAQRCGGPWRGRWRRARRVGRAHGECGVGPIRQLDDQVRINALPDPDQQGPLAAQRVRGMGDRDGCQR
jgi:hypothetical protein